MVIFSLLTTLLVAFIPALIWLFFFLKEDLHPEPKRLLAYTFSIGALMSIPTLAVQLLYQRTLGGANLFALSSVVGLALIEELFKFLGAYAAVHKDPAFDEPVDAMIYTVTAALGFATVENIGVLYGTQNSGALIGPAPALASFRLKARNLEAFQILLQKFRPTSNFSLEA